MPKKKVSKKVVKKVTKKVAKKVAKKVTKKVAKAAPKKAAKREATRYVIVIKEEPKKAPKAPKAAKPAPSTVISPATVRKPRKKNGQEATPALFLTAQLSEDTAIVEEPGTPVAVEVPAVAQPVAHVRLNIVKAGAPVKDPSKGAYCQNCDSAPEAEDPVEEEATQEEVSGEEYPKAEGEWDDDFEEDDGDDDNDIEEEDTDVQA